MALYQWHSQPKPKAQVPKITLFDVQFVADEIVYTSGRIGKPDREFLDDFTIHLHDRKAMANAFDFVTHATWLQVRHA